MARASAEERGPGEKMAQYVSSVSTREYESRFYAPLSGHHVMQSGVLRCLALTARPSAFRFGIRTILTP
jgi:hypothetical protein